MDVGELAPGLWRWTAPHPEWTPDQDWAQDVACLYWEGDDATCLVDPLVPADEAERFWHHLDADVERRGLPVAIVLTTADHERSAGAVAARYGGTVWAWHDDAVPLGVTADHRYGGGEQLAGGFGAVDLGRTEAALWLPARGTLVCGDALVGGPLRLSPWFDDGADRERTRAALRCLLELPIERVLVAHGESVFARGRDALARALADG